MTFTIKPSPAHFEDGSPVLYVLWQEDNQICRTKDVETAELIAEALNLKATNSNIISLLQNENMQIADRSMRMEIALRLIHTHVMGEVISQESGALRDWLSDWIVGFQNVAVTHGPVGGPMLWPASMPSVCRQLMMWGFHRTSGDIGYVALDPGQKAGELRQ